MQTSDPTVLGDRRMFRRGGKGGRRKRSSLKPLLAPFPCNLSLSEKVPISNSNAEREVEGTQKFTVKKNVLSYSFNAGP